MSQSEWLGCRVFIFDKNDSARADSNSLVLCHIHNSHITLNVT